MSKKSLLFVTIASVITTNAIANQVVTSQTYVDNGLAAKQDKITAGTTGAVVTYNGIQDGQTQFTERAIYDGSATYDSTTDANKLITAGAVNTMTPSLPTGTANAAVTYDANGNIGGERRIWTGNYDRITYEEETEDDPSVRQFLPQMSTLHSALEYISGISAANTRVNAGNRYNRVLVPSTNDRAGFDYISTVNSAASMNDDPSQYIPTMKAMEEKQNKMTCTRWLDTPENPDHTDENCLLWSIEN